MRMNKELVSNSNNNQLTTINYYYRRNNSDHLCKVYKIGKGSENIQADRWSKPNYIIIN